ncbi:MAG: ATP-binding protein [Spirochaetaceae bacterium]|jgi:hypothetical protein|nr:ATP-binding protein [Spirochaetaceae bacterium]
MKIRIDGASPLFDTSNMHYREFPSDYRQIRHITLQVIRSAPRKIREFNLLEQQISEIIKNGIKHGNKNDPAKKLKIWFIFTRHMARVIVEDEGKGFQDLERWNEFNRKRLECLNNGDFEELGNYISFRTEKSDHIDGGNALFAALEYWNGGFVFNERRNAVAMKKLFPQKEIFEEPPLPGFEPWDIDNLMS